VLILLKLNATLQYWNCNGLVLGKPIGIALFSFLAVTAGFCKLPEDLLENH
jgi:Na+/H+ antiporter NhaA